MDTGNGFQYKCLTGDLANMYTSLDHTSIRNAVHWLLHDVTKGNMRDRKKVSVPVSKTDNDLHFGTSCDVDKSRITLTYDDLTDIVNFDLNNSVFTVGSWTGKQTCGIPMGSPLSPALAVIVCAYYETKIFKKISSKGWNNKLLGTRYMDDILSVVTHDGSNESMNRAKVILKWIKYGYHKNMDLECEDTSVPFKFLSAMVTANGSSPLSIKHHNKNTAPIVMTGKQKFLNFQHYGSLSPKDQKLSVIISSLHRIDLNCSHPWDMVVSARSLFLELALLGYPAKIFFDALHRATNNRNLRWNEVVGFL